MLNKEDILRQLWYMNRYSAPVQEVKSMAISDNVDVFNITIPITKHDEYVIAYYLITLLYVISINF